MAAVQRVVLVEYEGVVGEVGDGRPRQEDAAVSDVTHVPAGGVLVVREEEGQGEAGGVGQGLCGWSGVLRRLGRVEDPVSN